MDPAERRLQDAISKLEQDESRARRRTVLYSMVPVAMGVLLVTYTGQKVASATRELDVLRDSTAQLQARLTELNGTAETLREELAETQTVLAEATDMERFRHPIDFVDLKMLASVNPRASRALEVTLGARQRGVPWRLGGVTPETGFDSPSFAAWVLDELGALPKQEGEGLLETSRALVQRLPAVAEPSPGDLAVYPAGYLLFWFRDVSGQPFVVGMTPFGVTSLRPDFSRVQGYRRVDY